MLLYTDGARPLTGKTMEKVDGYCVKCKCMKPIKFAYRDVLKNNKKAIKGACPDCGTGMCRIIG